MAVSEQELRIFHESMDRAFASGRFLDLFYDSFMESSEDIARIFAHSDMDRLKRKLKSSLHMMTLVADDAPGADMYLGHLARVHDRYDISAELFQGWLDALVSAVSQCDQQFDESTEAVWRKVVGKGMDVMLEGAEASVV
ncbi:MAG: globin [bacterium]